MFEVRYTPEAVEDLSSYNKRDRRRIMDQIDACLKHEPKRSYEDDHDFAPGQERSRAPQAGAAGERHFAIA